MTSEMDLLRMDERQRLAWLMANRGTVVAVGAVWVGMIVRELTQGRAPLFLIAMVPAFALVRVGLFFYYSRAPLDLGGSTAPGRIAFYVKIVAAILLALAVLLPLYSVAASEHGRAVADGVRHYGYAWRLAADDPVTVVPLALAFGWPVLVLLLLPRLSARRSELVLRILEPLLAGASSLLILWVPQMIFEFQVVLFFLVPAPARPEIGCYLAVVANGLYFVGWLSEFLRPWVVASPAGHGS